MNFSIKTPESDDDWKEYHRIRKTEIFDRLPHIKYDYNHPSLFSANNHHFCFLLDNIIIGTFQLELLGKDEAAIRTVAIDKALKNKGYGTELLEIAEKVLKNKDIKLIHLHANPKAYNFYKKNGYVEMEFKDVCVNAEAIDMGKRL